jgi:pyridoxal phosphate enzyme (YggS family)
MLTSPHFSAANAGANLRRRLEETRKRIASAALRCGRSDNSVALIAIGKGQPATSIRALAEANQRDFGENYLQEALPKLDALADLPLTWHYTGQIQANKTRPIAERFQWVHTLDRERIAVRLNDQRPPAAPPLYICIQIRLADEAGKGGITPEEAFDLASRIRTLPRLTLRGLMCIPPPSDHGIEQRAHFDALANCLAELNHRGFALDTLSMGMSDDLDAAIEAGATMVRVGTALFGARYREAVKP